MPECRVSTLHSGFFVNTKLVPDEIWNYDVRKYSQYLLRSSGTYDETWVIRNTAILHYCGKTKPWHAGFRNRFGNLYRHYQWIYERTR